jgi:DNA-3-methyladenine glycosylase II
MRRTLAFAAEARRHLHRTDRKLRPIIEQVGDCSLQRVTNRFAALAWSILAQQISTKAAASIRRRLLAALAPKPLMPESLLQLSDGEFRDVGVSSAKAKYLRDLAEKVASGQVALRSIHTRDDENVIAHLTQIKGIGRWTAEMFLIFSLGRPDVLPVDDLGLRVAVQRLESLEALPAPDYLRSRGRPWQPFRSIATWYLWQSLK